MISRLLVRIFLFKCSSARDVAAARAEQYEESLRLYELLPQHIQQTRVVWAGRIGAACAAGNLKRYLSIVEEYAVLFPTDSSAQARLLDVHFEREQWAEASADVDALDEAFPDAFWDTMRASIAMERGDHASALTLAEAVIQGDPRLYDGFNVALVASLALGDFVAADRFATRPRDDFQSDLALLAGNPDYESITQLSAFGQPAETTPQPQ